MKITVKNLDNKKVKDLDLAAEVFEYPYNEHLIHTAVRAILAAQRSGTHKTKGKGEVAGTGSKPYRQKGTGRARAGYIRSPLRRKGGTVHGPQPRDHSKKVTARDKRNALKSALSRKAADQEILVIDSLELGSHKTGELARRLDGLGITGKALLVDSGGNDELALAARNNPRLKTVDALGVNVVDVVDRPHVLLSEQALERLTEVLSR
jgi:large subunit ribosomal protein L4